MRIDNPSISGSLSFIGGNNSISATSVNLTGSFSGSVVGTFEGGFSSTATSDISGAFDSVSSSLASRVASQESFSSSLDSTFATDSDVTDVSNRVGTLEGKTLVSSSVQIASDISGSFTSLSSSLASELLKNTTDTLTGDLTVTGTLTAQDLHVQEVTSSIIYSSGSNVFGENVSDTQTFTGSLQVSGSIDLQAGDATFAADLNIAAGKKLKYSSNAFMTPENNVTGAEISTPGDFRVKTGTPPTLALTLGGSQDATFTNTVQIGEGSVTNLSLGANSSDFELSAKKNGTDAISMVFKTQASGGTLSEAMRITSGGDVGINYSGPFNQISGTETTLAISNGNIASLYLNNTHSNGHRWILTSGTDGAFGFYDKTEGATRMVIDSSGNVGIGTTDPDGKKLRIVHSTGQGLSLSLNSGSGTNVVQFGDTSDSDIGQISYDHTNNFMAFQTNNAERMHIDSSGNVGIGTNSPSYKTHIQGTGDHRLYLFNPGTTSSDKAVLQAEVSGSSSGNAYAFFGRTGAGWSSGVNVSANKYIIRSNWDVGEDASARLVIDSSGNVGIGTTTPSQKLHVNGNTILGGALYVASDGSYNTSAVYTFRDAVYINNPNSTSAAVSSNTVMSIGAMSGNSVNTSLITTGAVGIGTTTPNGKLHINTGTTGITQDIANQPSGTITFNNNSGGTAVPTITGKSSNNVGLYLSAATPDTPAASMDMLFDVRETDNTDFATLTSTAYRFARYGNSLLEIKRNGNVGIGNTSPVSALTVGTYISTHHQNHSSLPTVPGNHLVNLTPPSDTYYYGGGISWSEGTNTAASLGVYDAGGGGALGMYFATGNNTTLTERMRITNDGSVGIGVSPATTLHIANTSSSSTTQRISAASNTATYSYITHTDNTVNTARLKIGAVYGYNTPVDAIEIFNGRVGINGLPTTDTAQLYSTTPGSSQIECGLRIINPYGFASAGTGVRLAFAQDRSTSENYEMAAIQSEQSIAGTSTDGDLVFLTRGSNSVTERMRMTSDGNLGIGTTSPTDELHVQGNIRSTAGIISPTFYVARNYGSVSGNFAGYDDIVEGDIINILDHSIGSLDAFAHAQLDPVINGSSDSIDWNYFRLLFRYTNNTATYTNYTVGFKVASYFYSTGWSENSAEFSGTGMDGARGPRWAVSPWTTLGGTDVRGIGLKYYNNNDHTQTIRVHAIYIQYKS